MDTNIYKQSPGVVCRIGGFSCFVLLTYSLATLLIMSITGGPPDDIEQTFSILNENKFLGLLRLDLLTVFFIPFYYLLFYSLYIALKDADPNVAMISLILALAGTTLFLATPSVFSYLQLSDRFAASGNDYERNKLIAAGEAILVSDMWHGTGARIGGLLLQTGALLISILMLRSTVFNRATAITGIATHGLDLTHIIVGFFLPSLGNLFMFIAGPLYLIWFPMVGLRLYKLNFAQEQNHISTSIQP